MRAVRLANSKKYHYFRATEQPHRRALPEPRTHELIAATSFSRPLTSSVVCFRRRRCLHGRCLRRSCCTRPRKPYQPAQPLAARCSHPTSILVWELAHRRKRRRESLLRTCHCAASSLHHLRDILSAHAFCTGRQAQAIRLFCPLVGVVCRSFRRAAAVLARPSEGLVASAVAR